MTEPASIEVSMSKEDDSFIDPDLDTNLGKERKPEWIINELAC